MNHWLETLRWYADMGVDEAVADRAWNRFAEPEVRPSPANQGRPLLAAASRPSPPASPSTPPSATTSPVPPPRDARPAQMDALQPALAAELAAIETLDGLRDRLERFDGCALKTTATNTVFGEGPAHARLMIIGEAPGEEEDRQGRPFVGPSGQLLDRMLAAIGLARDHPDPGRAVYITNVLPWRPPGNRAPTPEEMALMIPFLRRHIALVDPDVLILMGNTPCGALLGRTGILRMRGTWTQAEDRSVMPMTHPAYLLRNPAAKREAWADLLEIQAKLRETP